MSDEITIFNQIRNIEQGGWKLSLASDSIGDWLELNNHSAGIKGIPVNSLLHAAHVIEGYNLCARIKPGEAGQ
jgi:hypothetical protein